MTHSLTRPEAGPLPDHDVPVRVECRLDEPLSRWLWLVKWLLVVPHAVVLGVLWVGYVLLTAVAFVAILFTGRYPSGIFAFNLGVLRWTWRVTYYAYGALGTDRYPPFTLADVPDYPARLEVAVPRRLSRGLVLVKWLLVLPHAILIAAVTGGVGWLVRNPDGGFDWLGVNLLGALVLVSAVVLAVTGSYPRSLFDLVIGMQRWVLRVGAYAGLMTDAYPPFRLDLGGTESAPDQVVPIATSPSGPRTDAPPPAARPTGPVPAPQPGAGGWTAPRVVLLVVGCLVAMVGAGGAVSGGAVLWADRTQRDAAGYLVSETERFDTAGHALVSAPFDIDPDVGYLFPDSVVGTVRLRVTPTGDDPVFVGLGRSAAVDGYLDPVRHSRIDDIDAGPQYEQVDGGAAGPPADALDWAVSAQGTGTQTLDWRPRSGDWTLVVARPDGAAGVSVDMDLGVTAPVLAPVGMGLLIGGLVLQGIGAAMAAGAVGGALRRRDTHLTTTRELTR